MCITSSELFDGFSLRWFAILLNDDGTGFICIVECKSNRYHAPSCSMQIEFQNNIHVEEES
jgi:hypothetical protein